MEKIKNTIHKTVLNLLYPIVQLLLRYEIAHSEFTKLTRRSSVDVAFKDFVLPNRKNSVSRVSVITGLSRSEVARLAAAEKDLISKGNTTPNRATRAFGGWLSDSGFIDKNNEPKILPLPTPISVLKRWLAATVAAAFMDEILRVGAVEKVDKDPVKLIHLSSLFTGLTQTSGICRWFFYARVL